MNGESWGDELRGPVGWPPPRPASVDVDARRAGVGARRVAAGGGPSSAAGVPLPPPSSPGQLITFPPDFFPSEGATDFQLFGFAAGLVPGSGEVILDTFQLPANDRGVIRSVVFGVNDYTAVGQIRFRVLISNAAPPGWGNIIIPPQAAAFASFSYGPEETRIPVPPGKQVRVVVQVLAGGPFGASATVHGWHWQEL